MNWKLHLVDSNCVLMVPICFDFSGIIKQFGNHVARIAIVFMIFSTGMFISAAGEYKC